MSIVSSELIDHSPQIDNRFWSGERHIDQLGVVYEFRYLADQGTDATAAMTARVSLINAFLISNEIASNLSDVLANGSLAAPVLNYSTMTQNFAVFRAIYATLTKVEAIMAGDFLSSLTDGQLRTAFGITQGQVTTLRTNKLTPAIAAAATIRASTGA